MAAFDEAVRQKGIDTSPTSTGEYLRWGDKEITTPTYPSARAKAFEGVEKAFEGSKELDEAAKKYVGNVSEDRADKLAKSHLADLDEVYQQVYPGQSTTSLTPSTIDANGYDTSKVPPGVTNSVDKIASIKAARDQGGLPAHLRDLEFKKQAYMELQKTRSEFPTYRDYADKKFGEVLGFVPTANEVRKTILADLNEAFNKKDQDLNKLDTKLGEYNHIAGVADIRTAVKSGKMTVDQGWHELARITAFKGAGDLAKSATEVRTAQKGFDEDQGRAAINSYAPDVTDTAVKATFRSVFPKDEDIANATDDHWRLLGQKLQMAKIQTQNHLDAYYAGWKGADGAYHPGIKDRMGDSYDKVRNDAMAGFTNWEKVITDRDVGMAHRLKNGVEARENTLKYNALTGKNETSKWYQSMYLLKEMGGAGFQFSASTVPGYNPPGKSKESAAALDAILGSASGGLGLGGINSIKDALGLINTEEKGKNPEVAATHINDVAAALKDSSVDGNKKANLAKYTYGPGTEGWLGKINMEAVDPNTGQVVATGRHAIFWQYTDPAMVKSIKDLNDPVAWKNYQDWTDNTFRRDIIAPDLANLKNLQRVSGMQLKLHIDHSGKTPIQFELTPGGNPSESPTQAQYGVPPYAPAMVRLEINKLNTALKAYHNVDPGSTNGKFLQMLQAAQVDLSNPGVKDNMFEHILLSIRSARAPVEGSKKTQGSVNP